MDDRDYRPRRGTLYRDPENGKICGVCAGIAEHFGFETWVVRIISASMLLFLGPGAILAYFIACWVLDVKPGTRGSKSARSSSRQNESTTHERRYRPKVNEVWKKGTSASSTVQRVQKRFKKMEENLRPMESFVTSDKFALHKEFESIQDEPVNRD